MADFDKMKCLDVFIEKGKVIHIPAYWWYSIKFNKDTSVSCFHYRTYMNNLAISPYIIMHGLQNQNTKIETIKKMDINKLAKTEESTTVVEKETPIDKSGETPSENKIDL
jgi:hypothetical protein